MRNKQAFTTMKWWSGLRTIGGNIVSLEYKDSRLIFDFGFIPHANSEILDETVRIRKSRLVYDYISLGLAPKMDGIYEEKDIENIPNLRSFQDDGKNTAVLVSHLHLDHIGLLGMLSPQVPVYATEDSIRLYRVLEEIGENVPGYQPNLQECTYKQPFQLGSFIITPIEVDHDVPGACGFHIKTPDGSLFYMGDFRMHGYHPEKIDNAIQSVKKLGVDILIMEGTTLGNLEDMKEPLIPEEKIGIRTRKEADIPNKMQDILKSCSGMGVFNIYHRNVERLEAILKLNQKIDRMVVLEPETAYIAEKLINTTNTTDVLIYLSSETKKRFKNKQIAQWEQTLLKEYRTVDAIEINQNPKGFFVQNSYENILELLDLEVSDGVYLHSNGPPLGDYDTSYQHLKRLLKHLGVKRIQVGSGGHALPNHLKYVVEKINPDFFIPIHSFHPERLVPDYARLLLPEYGVTYAIKNGHVFRSDCL